MDNIIEITIDKEIEIAVLKQSIELEETNFRVKNQESTN